MVTLFLRLLKKQQPMPKKLSLSEEIKAYFVKLKVTLNQGLEKVYIMDIYNDQQINVYLHLIINELVQSVKCLRDIFWLKIIIHNFEQSLTPFQHKLLKMYSQCLIIVSDCGLSFLKVCSLKDFPLNPHNILAYSNLTFEIQ